MIHKMRLHNDAFVLIQNGTKTIEMRLNDEKRQKIKINDKIEFENIITGEKLQVIVIGLHKFNNFYELYKNFDKSCLGYEEKENANFNDMNKYYSDSEQKKYCVLAIEIKII